MADTPWSGLDGMHAYPKEAGELSHRDYAARNPCLTCQGTPCCWYLHLRSVRPREFKDIDFLSYLLNFDGIELLVSDIRSWGVNLRRPCSHLNQTTGRCTIRDTPDHP